MVIMLGVGDLSPSAKHDAELRKMVGHDVERRSPVRQVVPDHLERRFAEVISVIKALREEVHKSDRERKESDKAKRSNTRSWFV
ncbi:hypothetical protein Q3G72_007131 [Acer saccharum]|nr:hypothetical protein Q3G72_007131 [Acer saccharum]